MRVHELAKKLNISSKEICQFLSTSEKTYTAANGLTDEEEKRVKDRYEKGAKAPVKEDKAEKEVKPEAKPAVKPVEKNVSDNKKA